MTILNLLFLLAVLSLKANACVTRQNIKKYFAQGSSWNAVFTTFNQFHEIPLTKSAAINEGFALMVRDNDLNVEFFAYKSDPRLAVGYDSYGQIAGLRVSYIKADLDSRAKKNNLTYPYTFADKPTFTSATYFGQDVWYNTVLFVNPEKLKKGGRASTKKIVAEDIYVRLDGVWKVIPKNECDATSVGFVKQQCYKQMGMHYFYKISPTMGGCEDVVGAFGLYQNGVLMGMGLNVFGAQTNGKDRIWLEDTPVDLLKRIIPNRNECVIDWTDKFGAFTIHVFFNKQAFSVECDKSTTNHVCQKKLV